MSSENTNLNLEAGLEGKTENKSEIKCEEEENVINPPETSVETDTPGNLDTDCNSSSNDRNLCINYNIDQNLGANNSQSSVKAEISPTVYEANAESGDSKCDICSSVDVENITNSLAEKINIKNIDLYNSIEANVAKCDTRNVNKTDLEKAIAEVVVVHEKLVNQINQLEITGFLNQSTSQNKSAVILRKETESLKNLLAYDSSTDDEDENEAEPGQNWQFRTVDKSDSDSDDSISSNDEDEDDEDDVRPEPKKSKVVPQLHSQPLLKDDFILKVYSENNLEDLPPVRDVSNLDIDLEKEEFIHMGHVEAVINTLITVEAIPGTPAYDLDTCLFIELKTKKQPLGAVYDVIGPVLSPLYCIRFECSKTIKEFNIKKGMKVFCAPKSQYTRYVFVSELMKNKGTDASWVGDIELPPEIASQLSDDEPEAEPEETRKPQKRKHHSQERYKQYEENMNRCNALNSQATRLVDTQRHTPRISRFNDHVQRVLFDDVIAQSSRLPPSFDPSVPPPGFHVFHRNQPIIRPPMMWNRQDSAAALRAPRCHPFYGYSQSHYSNNYTNNDTSHGPGTSSHPY